MLSVWSTDWFKNKEKQIERLENAIEKAINRSEQHPIVPSESEIISPITREIKREATPIFDRVYPSKNEIIQRASSDSHRIEAILDEMVPVHIKTLQSVIPFLYGRERFSSVVEKNFSREYRQLNLNTYYKKIGHFYYSRNQPILFRKNAPQSIKRDFTHIAKEELAEAYNIIVNEAKDISLTNLKREILHLTGFKKMSKEMDHHFKESIQYFIGFYDVELINDSIVLTAD